MTASQDLFDTLFASVVSGCHCVTRYSGKLAVAAPSLAPFHSIPTQAKGNLLQRESPWLKHGNEFYFFFVRTPDRKGDGELDELSFFSTGCRSKAPRLDSLASLATRVQGCQGCLPILTFLGELTPCCETKGARTVSLVEGA